MTGPEEFEHAFRLEQQEAEKLRFLQRAWQQGIDSGAAGEVDFSALKQEARARLAASKESTENTKTCRWCLSAPAR